jgi:anti-sigma factor RsiW
VTHDEAIQLLPCYVSGDLPPEIMAELDQVVTQDPELAQLADQLREQNERTMRALCSDVPDAILSAWNLDDAGPLPDTVEEPTPRHSGTPFLITVAALAAAVLLAVVLAWSIGPDQQTPASVESVAYAHEIAMNGQLEALSPMDTLALGRAFAAAGVPSRIRDVPDLTDLGLEPEAVYIVPGQPPGSAVRYRSAETEYLCQMWLGMDIPGRGVVQSEIGDVQLHGYQSDGLSLVMWNEGNLLCIMSADVPLDDLLALAERRVASG